MQQSEQLSILSAVYGKKDVSDVIRSLIQEGCAQIKADNQIFGDSFPNVRKTLVIVYQYGTNKPIVSITEEGDFATFSSSNNNQQEWMTYQPGQMMILAAVYGLADVTDKVNQNLQNNSLNIRAHNSVFGDNWSGVRKVLTVVYKDANGTIRTSIEEEDGWIQIGASQQHQQHSQGIPKILGAAYGKVNLTDKVRSMITDGFLKIPAENYLFGDSFPGILKSFVVVYQFGNSKPRVGIVQEHQTLTLSEDNQNSEPFIMETGQVQILGAAYGLADVTNKVVSRIQNSSLQIRADNQTFEDNWYGTRKTLVIVYQDLQGNIKTSITEEESSVKISFKTQSQQSLKILGAAYGKTNVTEKVRLMVAEGNRKIPAKNHIFGDSFEGVLKSLVVVYQFGNSKPHVGVVKEHQILTLSEDNHYSEWDSTNFEKAQILGAVYGLADVTNKIASRIQNSILEVRADNETLGDGWPGTRKTLVIVYRDPQGNIKTSIVEEEGYLRRSFQQYWGASPQQVPTVLGAVYGKTNITDQVRTQVANGCLQIKATNSLFGDSFPNVQKSLMVVYQFENAPPQVGIAKEGQTVNLNQTHQSYQWLPPQLGQSRILGAVYGLVDVTNKVVSRIKNSVLEVKADNETFGDNWHGTLKTFVLVYQDPQGHINTEIIEEGGSLKIILQQQQLQFTGNINYNNQQPYFGGQPNYGSNFPPQFGGYQPQYNGQFPPQIGGYQPSFGNYFQPQPQCNGNFPPQFNDAQLQYGNHGGFAKQI